MNYPTIVYKDGGSHHRHGGMYSWKPVKDQAEFDAAVKDGWFSTLNEAIEGQHNEESEAGPTREELEMKAKELGVKFDGRTTDAKLAKLIAEKV